jgi:heterodisulfide reductase subunit B
MKDKMKVSYYPGCSLEVTARPYDLSTRLVCRSLDIELQEVPEWVCCGSSAGLKMNRLLSLSLAAQNLAQIEKQASEEVMIPCPFCFRRLLSARQEMEQDLKTRALVQNTIETELKNPIRFHNILEFFHDQVGLSAIENKIQKPLAGLKLIPYYGCYLVKPWQLTRFDHPENPTSMDDILGALGAEVLDWDFKTECCGASLSLTKTEKVRELSGRLLTEARWKGAEAMVVACQLCQSNLDMRQGEIWKAKKESHHIPVLYITQLMGLALGHSPQDLGLDKHIVDPLPILKEKGLCS